MATIQYQVKVKARLGQGRSERWVLVDIGLGIEQASNCARAHMAQGKKVRLEPYFVDPARIISAS